MVEGNGLRGKETKDEEEIILIYTNIYREQYTHSIFTMIKDGIPNNIMIIYK